MPPPDCKIDLSSRAFPPIKTRTNHAYAKSASHRRPLYFQQGLELKQLEGHRTAKFLSLLAENLVRKGLLNEQEVLNMLDQVVD